MPAVSTTNTQVAKMQRVILTEAEWTELRVRAAREDIAVQALIARILSEFVAEKART